MNTDYSGWHIDDLMRHQKILHRMLRAGENYPDVVEHLKAIQNEIDLRDFALVLTIDGQHEFTYGEWRTEADCVQHAKQMSLTIGQDYQVGDKVYKLEIRRLT